MRIGVAVGALLALGLPTSVVAQNAPPLQRAADPVRIALSGSARGEFFFRDRAVEEWRAALNGTSLPQATESLLPLEVSLRVDVDALDRAGLVAEIGNLPFLDGRNLPLGERGPRVVVRQLYVDLEGIFLESLSFRIGAFEYAWRIRPHDEPFFLDVARSESFYSGTVRTASSAFTRATADRDLNRPAGIRAEWRPLDFVQIEAGAILVREGGPPSEDEALYMVLANVPASERTAFFLGAAWVAGPGSKADVVTIALGGNGYFGRARDVEAFGEIYLQYGTLSADVSKRAWAAQGGLRWYGGGPWAELAFAHRSGDRDPSDGRDGAFQSYENQNRFLIAESAEFGWDWDTNLQVVRGVLAHGLAEDGEARLDAGWFRAPERILDGTGVPLTGARGLGVEVDASLRVAVTSAMAGSVRVAALTGSDVLEAVSPSRSRRAWGVSAGLALAW
ncbi:MAG: hypothetical protein HY716_02700 [Planctomycetes bacterium]|nr:hypothetical protein [Planctomycetota bacterium]